MIAIFQRQNLQTHWWTYFEVLPCSYTWQFSWKRAICSGIALPIASLSLCMGSSISGGSSFSVSYSRGKLCAYIQLNQPTMCDKSTIQNIKTHSPRARVAASSHVWEVCLCCRAGKTTGACTLWSATARPAPDTVTQFWTKTQRAKLCALFKNRCHLTLIGLSAWT